MSRAKATDVSSPISLFPFIGVLLCTMGALLVVLIAVSPSARAVAYRQAASQRKLTIADENPQARAQLERVTQYVSNLNRVRTEAERKLRDDQLRLSHLEDHMRRLEDKVKSLQLAALELQELEKEHYDDREQAEREVGRLQQLIAQTRQAIDALKAEQLTEKRSYALVPYDGPNGTFRRPIYIECCNDELILQPEGIRLTKDDLRPPCGAGNPLAAALRAARDHLLRLHPEEGKNRDTEPYPLVVVRPSGTVMFGPAQRAIQTGDFDLGYELVEEDWDLKFPAPDPQLAVVVHQAIDQARVRQQALAAAAPRAYHNPTLAATGRFDFDETAPVRFAEDADSSAGGNGEGGLFGGGGGGGTGSAGGPNQPTDASANTVADGPHAPDGSLAGGSPSGDSHNYGSGGGELGGKPGASGGAGGPRTDNPGGPLPAGSSVPPRSGAIAGNPAGSSSASPTSMSPANGSSTSAGAGGGGGGEMSGSSPNMPEGDYSQMQTELAKSRGQDWALQRKKPRAVPVRRSIPMIVRNDQIAILSDETRQNGRAPAGKTIPLHGDTVQSIDELVKAVQQQIDGWGMAGDGLYWRPVLSLHVGPDGGRRAQDLMRLLKNSGLELQPAATVKVYPQGNSGATTR